MLTASCNRLISRPISQFGAQRFFLLRTFASLLSDAERSKSMQELSSKHNSLSKWEEVNTRTFLIIFLVEFQS